MATAKIELRMARDPVRVNLLSEVTAQPRRVALGTFDGVHLGHQRVIRGMDTLLTFSRHPRSIVGEAPKLLTDLATKIERLQALGVSEIVLLPFDRETAELSPERFVDEILVDNLGTTEISVGENFRFGHRASGGADDLLADARFATRVVPLMRSAGEVISSTRIRTLIEEGRLLEAELLLGGPFTVRCLVSSRNEAGEITGLLWPEEVIQPASTRCSARLHSTPDGAAGFELTKSPDDDRLWHCSPLSRAIAESDEVAIDLCRDERSG
ncbi:MAG TPA: FAD synthetase family protein [Solirubrobacterales bacterium]|jgi:riboflavin kinase/FMN adenylyltransferase